MHTIRLREPWQSSWKSSASGTSVVYRRDFHCPTGTENHRLYLSLSPVAKPVTGMIVTLNGDILLLNAGTTEHRAELTHKLQPFNSLGIVIPCERPVEDNEPPSIESLLTASLQIVPLP